MGKYSKKGKTNNPFTALLIGPLHSVRKSTKDYFSWAHVLPYAFSVHPKEFKGNKTADDYIYLKKPYRLAEVWARATSSTDRGKLYGAARFAKRVTKIF